ncbi:disintegrin and metalloproteinase domain-containing protein 10-like [Ornithodoros turicata]|uniref:disintegrin and metalloproteinase domain-containing protein 10-like n=1 Tax=Ornithodoros turicata TaxID=34597 RepID=UPI003139CCAA
MKYRSLLLLLCCVNTMAERLSKFIRNYQLLYFTQQPPKRRPLQPKIANTQANIRFSAYGRTFSLLLSRDTSTFVDDFVALSNNEVVDLDISHIYSGALAGDAGSHVFGSVAGGVFEGRITAGDGTIFYVEPLWKYLNNATSHQHAIIYRAQDVELPQLIASDSSCGVDRLYDNASHLVNQWTSGLVRPQIINRHAMHKRSVDYVEAEGMLEVDDEPRAARNRSSRQGRRVRRMCHLEILVDHTMFAAYLLGAGDSSTARSRIAGTVASHVDTLNRIYSTTAFGRFRGILFRVQSLTINDTESCGGREKESNPFCAEDLDPTTLLDLVSSADHNDFCLSFLWTFRDFASGTLGLAFIAHPDERPGGICEKYQRLNTRRGAIKNMGLNTGVVTFVNHGHVMSSRISELTFAHEVGHSFGARHDVSPQCAPGGELGNYIMFPKASPGNLPNNYNFSQCSVADITTVLTAFFESRHDKENCFLASDVPFCGNNIREGDEECDCGYNDAECKDRCCYSQRNPERKKGCKLRPNASCSPTAGPCCSSSCQFLPITDKCSPEDDCNFASYCNSVSALCPSPVPKHDKTPCNRYTQVCLQGRCEGSICLKYGFEDCQLSGSQHSPDVQCSLFCRTSGTTNVCLDPCKTPVLKSLCGRKRQPGALCNNNMGYCDVFHKCRGIDEEGPLTRLEALLFRRSRGLHQWVEDNAWIVAAGCVFVMFGIVIFIRCCAIFTPSSHPKLSKSITIKEGIRHPQEIFLSSIKLQANHRPAK